LLSESSADATDAAIVDPMLVSGGRDMDAGADSMCFLHGGQQGAKPNWEVVADILAVIKERRV
jgi:hypothetical protein